MGIIQVDKALTKLAGGLKQSVVKIRNLYILLSLRSHYSVYTSNVELYKKQQKWQWGGFLWQGEGCYQQGYIIQFNTFSTSRYR